MSTIDKATAAKIATLINQRECGEIIARDAIGANPETFDKRRYDAGRRMADEATADLRALGIPVLD